MKRFLSTVLAMLCAGALVYLLVSNRQMAYLSLDPTNVEEPALAFGPTYTAVHIVVGLVLGFVLGAVGMYSSGTSRRRELRERRRQVRRLEEELREARQDLYQTRPQRSELVAVSAPNNGRTDVLTVNG